MTDIVQAMSLVSTKYVAQTIVNSADDHFQAGGKSRHIFERLRQLGFLSQERAGL
jgi:hypothetical protein